MNIIYEAFDGKKFDNYDDCANYEKKLKEEGKEDEEMKDAQRAQFRRNMVEYRRSQIMATGNKWAIENFNATH